MVNFDLLTCHLAYHPKKQKKTYKGLHEQLAFSLDSYQAFSAIVPWQFLKCKATVQIQNLTFLVVSDGRFLFQSLGATRNAKTVGVELEVERGKFSVKKF